MLYSQSNITKVFIGKSIARTAALDVAGTLVTPSNLAVGEIVITDMSNNILDTTTAASASAIKIIQGRGSSEPLRQDMLKLSDVVVYSGRTYVAPVEQVTYVGFNGTSGSIEVIPENLYFLRISRIFNTFLRGNQLVPKYGQFTSGTSTTQEAVATGLLKNLIANFQMEYKLEKDIQFDMVLSNAGTAVTVAAGADLTDLSYVKGSKVVTGFLSGAPALGTDEVFNNISVGDYLRAGTATTAACYKVTAVTAGTASTPATITLDVPFQGESTIIALASNEVITAAQAAAGSFGIKMSGRALKFDVLRWRQYDKLRWNVTLDGFGATPITFTTAANPGLGTFEEVAAQEFMSWGNEGQNLVIQTPPLIPEADVSTSGTYSTINIGFKNEVRGLVGAGENKGNFLLYLANSTNVTNFTGASGNTSAIAVLNAFLNQAGFAALTQGTDY